eukprot:3453967-Rhodomonas_salina.1
MVLAGLLGPINMHTLVLGLEVAASAASFQSMRAESDGLKTVKAAETDRTETKWHEEAVREKLSAPIKKLQSDQSEKREEKKKMASDLKLLEKTSQKETEKLEKKLE